VERSPDETGAPGDGGGWRRVAEKGLRTAWASIQIRHASGYALNVPETVPIACKRVNRLVTGGLMLAEPNRVFPTDEGVISSERDSQLSLARVRVNHLRHILGNLRPLNESQPMCCRVRSPPRLGWSV